MGTGTYQAKITPPPPHAPVQLLQQVCLLPVGFVCNYIMSGAHSSWLCLIRLLSMIISVKYRWKGRSIFILIPSPLPYVHGRWTIRNPFSKRMSLKGFFKRFWPKHEVSGICSSGGGAPLSNKKKPGVFSLRGHWNRDFWELICGSRTIYHRGKNWGHGNFLNSVRSTNLLKKIEEDRLFLQVYYLTF